MALRTTFSSPLGGDVRVTPILAFILLTPGHAPLPPPEGTDGLGLQLSGFYRGRICGLNRSDFEIDGRALVKLYHDEFYAPYRLSPGLTRLLTQHPLASTAAYGMFPDQEEFLRVSDVVRDQSTVVLGGWLGRLYPGHLARYCLLHAHVNPTAAPTAPPTSDPSSGATGRRLQQEAEEVRPACREKTCVGAPCCRSWFSRGSAARNSIVS